MLVAQWPVRGGAVPTSHPPPPTRHPLLPHTPLPCRKLLHRASPWLPQDEGEEVSLELPPTAKGSAQLPFPAPPPLKAVLLDVELPMSLVCLLCLPSCIPDPLGMGLHPAHISWLCLLESTGGDRLASCAALVQLESRVHAQLPRPLPSRLRTPHSRSLAAAPCTVHMHPRDIPGSPTMHPRMDCARTPQPPCLLHPSALWLALLHSSLLAARTLPANPTSTSS